MPGPKLIELTNVFGLLPGASNTTLLADDSDGVWWVYKPVAGERPLWDFEHGSLAAREVLAFEVSGAMGLELVPETRFAQGPLGEGSAQRFVHLDPEFDPLGLFRPVLSPRLWDLAVFDLMTNNADRKVGHLISEIETGHLWAIDNGLTFHSEDKLRTVLWGLAGQPVPEPLVQAVVTLRDSLDAGLADQVARLLSEPEAMALSARVDALLDDPVHPEPPSDRPPVPWPAW